MLRKKKNLFWIKSEKNVKGKGMSGDIKRK
jgi:hypothetical protein